MPALRTRAGPASVADVDDQPINGRRPGRIYKPREEPSNAESAFSPRYRLGKIPQNAFVGCDLPVGTPTLGPKHRPGHNDFANALIRAGGQRDADVLDSAVADIEQQIMNPPYRFAARVDDDPISNRIQGVKFVHATAVVLT